MNSKKIYTIGFQRNYTNRRFSHSLLVTCSVTLGVVAFGCLFLFNSSVPSVPSHEAIHHCPQNARWKATRVVQLEMEHIIIDLRFHGFFSSFPSITFPSWTSVFASDHAFSTHNNIRGRELSTDFRKDEFSNEQITLQMPKYVLWHRDANNEEELMV